MIAISEIKKAIKNKIENALFSSEFATVSIVASDLSEPIERPSIKILLDNTKSARLNKLKERTLTVRVYFFATNLREYAIENMKIEELIENEFLTPIKVNDTFYIEVDEVESVVSDTVLICSFDLEMLEDIPEEIIDEGVNYEPMENLNINLESEE